jgi:mono/diheme cytochrome c family protein
MSGRLPMLSTLTAMFVAVVAGGSFVQWAAAQGNDPEIWSGVYTAAQAERGKTRFLSSCSNCHNFDLKGSGIRGPALTGDSFMTNWDAQGLNDLFEKIQGTMPRNNPSSLPDEVYLDIMAYILQVNVFPAGSKELKAEALDGIQIVRQGDTGRKVVPNFAIVQMVGCLVQGPDNTWILANTSEPVVSKDQPSTEEELRKLDAKPLGADRFLLVSVLPFEPYSHKGQKVAAKGLFYKAPNENRLNVTSLQTVMSSCGN